MAQKKFIDECNESLIAVEIIGISKVDDYYAVVVRDKETYDLYVKKSESVTRLTKEILDLDDEILMVRDFVNWFEN